ncbi:hypothetical protein BGX24_010832 [Mortierella sp. AD032]|nr:hypothetical protein BGX24_010832 [Mortierella sp. AD032]
MRVSYSGPAKCSLIFESLKYCPCSTCDSWTTLETQLFKNDHQRTYGVIDLEGYDQVVMFEVCYDHQMFMNLVAYPDREGACTSDLDLFVCGSRRNTRWSDNAVFEDNLCVVTVEVYQAASSSCLSPSPSPPIVTYRLRGPQAFIDHLDNDSDIKVEVDDHRHGNGSDLKVEVDNYYRPKSTMPSMPSMPSMPIPRPISTMPSMPIPRPISTVPSMPIPRPTPAPISVSIFNKQEIFYNQFGPSSPPPTLPPRPPTFQSRFTCNQIYTPPPVTTKNVEKEVDWAQQSFPLPPPLPPRPCPIRTEEQEDESFLIKASKHALWRRFHARIRPRS